MLKCSFSWLPTTSALSHCAVINSSAWGWCHSLYCFVSHIFLVFLKDWTRCISWYLLLGYYNYRYFTHHECCCCGGGGGGETKEIKEVMLVLVLTHWCLYCCLIAAVCTVTASGSASSSDRQCQGLSFAKIIKSGPCLTPVWIIVC